MLFWDHARKWPALFNTNIVKPGFKCDRSSVMKSSSKWLRPLCESSAGFFTLFLLSCKRPREATAQESSAHWVSVRPNTYNRIAVRVCPINLSLVESVRHLVILVSQLTPLQGPLTLEVILNKKRLFNQVILPESIHSMPSFICRKLLQATSSTNLSWSHSHLLKQILANEKLSLDSTPSRRSLTRALTASDKWNKCLT